VTMSGYSDEYRETAMIDLLPADILLPLFATWTLVTIALACGAYGLECAVVDRLTQEPLGPEYWGVAAGGGAAVGGLVALGSIVQSGTGFELAHYATIALFGLTDVALVGFGRWFVAVAVKG
jgi:hypothetical protein